MVLDTVSNTRNAVETELLHDAVDDARGGGRVGLEAFVQHENIFLATSEPRPVRVGPAWKAQGDAVVPH